MKYRFLLHILILIVSAIWSNYAYSQVRGKVVDETGSAMSFASVYVQGTTIGTTSNEAGEYFLDLDPGEYVIICEYLGFTAVEKSISVKTGHVVNLDFVIIPMAFSLSELQISADREDPAYAIIRKAQEHRKKNQVADMPQKCGMYMKGNISMEETPTTIMGINIEEGIAEFDSIGSKVLYLSETISTLYRSESGLQEVVESSRVSGSSMYSFNRGAMVEYSIYDRTLKAPFGPMINPIGPSAFTYYRYRLLSSEPTENGILNTIAVETKNTREPTVDGIIYISEDGWQVSGFSFTSTGKRMKAEVIDTFKLEQEYIKAKDNRVLFKNRLDIKIKLLGFGMHGTFLSVYTDYVFGEEAISPVNKRQFLTFQDSSQNKTSDYWAEVRPIKLTELEDKDYHIKDSISLVENSPEYRDSIERIYNHYSFMNALSGYTYRKRAKGFKVSHTGLATGLKFDAVQGFNLSFGVSSTIRNKLSVDGEISYGFSEKSVRYNAGALYEFNKNKSQIIKFRTGRIIKDVNSVEPFTYELNEFMSLIFHKNLIKFYDTEFYNLIYRQRVHPALFMNVYSDYQKRNSLQNNTNYSFWFKDKEYQENHVSIGDGISTVGMNNTRYRIGTKWEYFPGTRYTVYPGGVIETYQNRFNKLTLTYDAAIPIYSNVYYHKIKLDYASSFYRGIGARGLFYVALDFFVGPTKLGVQDLLWQNDNGSIYTNAADVSRRFIGMDSYKYYSDKYAFQLHYYHDFQGMILNKIPIIKNLGWSMSSKVSTLFLPIKKNYSEASLGIDNIGWKLFRPLRFDVVLPLENYKLGKVRYVIGMKISLADFSNNSVSVSL